MDTMNSYQDTVEGRQVRNLLTRFYYRSSQLYFQLILELKSGDCVLFREFDNYSVFKEAFDNLQTATRSEVSIHIPENKPEVVLQP
jgi:hypothetical protein